MKEDRLQIRIEPQLKKQFQEICDRKNYNLSGVLRTLIQDWIEKEQGEK